MKHRRLLWMLLMLLVSTAYVPATAQEETLTVNDGTTTNSFVPVYDNASYYQRVQFIIPSGQLTAMKDKMLKKITFHSSTANFSSTGKYNVYLKEIENTSFSSQYFLDNTDAVQIQSGGTFSLVNKEMEITVPEDAFEYEGGSLLIEIALTSKATGNTTLYWYGVSSSSNQCLRATNNSSSTINSGSYNTFLPKTTLTYESVGAVAKPKNLALSGEVGKRSATLAWEDTKNENATYELYWSTSSTAPDENTTPSITGVSAKTYSITGLTPETTYYAWVRAKVGDEYSKWSTVCEFTPSASQKFEVNETASSTSYFGPVYYNSSYASRYTRSQFIIPASSLTGLVGKTITQLTFYGSTTGTFNWSNGTFKVEMMETSSTTTTFSNTAFLTGTEEVYSGTLSYENGEMTVTLDKPFTYTGTGSLLIGLDRQTTTYSAIKWYYTATGTSSTYYYLCSYSTSKTPTSGNNRYNYVPRVTFTYISLPYGLTASDIAKKSATLTWNAAGSEIEWQLSYGTTADPESGTKVAVTGTPTYNLTELTSETTYYAYVRAKDSDGEYGGWSTVCAFTPSAAQTITVNDGTGTNSYLPLYGGTSYYTRQQFIIPKSQLEDMAGGTIKKIVFYSSSSYSNVSWGSNKYNVMLMETDNTTYSSNSFYANTDSTRVYTTGTLSVVGNQMVITFTKDFEYSGDKNLMIEIASTAKGTSSSLTWLGEAQTSGTYTGVYGSNNSSSGNSITSANRQAFLPKTSFVYMPQGVAKPKNLAVSNVTKNSATLTWTGSDDVDGYELSYSTTADDPDNGTKVNVADNEYALTGLTSEVDYYVYVRALKDDETSKWSDVCDFTPGLTKTTISDGTATNSYIPINTAALAGQSNKGQFIVPKATLEAAGISGKISKLVFHSSTASNTLYGATFNVYLAETDNTSYSSNTIIYPSDTARVCTAAALSIVDNKMVVKFSKPFEYSGNKNLLIGIDRAGAASSNPGSVNWYGVTSGVTSNCGVYSGYNTGRATFLPKMDVYYVQKTEVTQDGFTLKMNDDKNAFIVTAYDDSSTTPTVPSSVTYEGNSYPVTAIAGDALKNHTTLTEITIPSSITAIGTDAFAGCTSMEWVTFEGTTIPTWADGTVGNEFATAATGDTWLIVPAAAKTDYKTTYTAWADYILTSKAEQPTVTTVTVGDYTYRCVYDPVEQTTTATATAYNGSATSIDLAAIPATVESGGRTYTVGTTAQSIYDGTSVQWLYTTTGSAVTINKYLGTATELTIPATMGGNTVTNIAAGAFSGKTTVRKVQFESTTPPTWGDGNVGQEFNTPASTFILVTAEQEQAFKTAYPAWAEAIVTEIPDYSEFEFYCYQGTPNYAVLYGYTGSGGNIRIPGHVVKDGVDYTVTQIKKYPSNGTPFAGNTTITGITIPSTVSQIDGYVFQGCTALETVNYPNAPAGTTIGSSAFEECTSLTSLTLPEGLTTIGLFAFYKCSALTTVTIPSTVTSISASFSNCFGVTSAIFLPTTPPTWDDAKTGQEFNGKENTILVVPVSENNTVLQAYQQAYTAWYNADAIVTNLGNIITVNGLTYAVVEGTTTAKLIGYTEDVPATAVIASTVNNGAADFTVTTIEEGALKNCTAITSLTIPATVTAISGMSNESPFIGCTNVSSVTFLGTTPPTWNNEVMGTDFNTPSGTVLYVPANAIDTYAGTYSRWMGVLYPSGYTAADMSDFTFEYYDNREYAVITGYTGSSSQVAVPRGAYYPSYGRPSPITAIADNVFKNHTELTDVYIPSTITTVGASAFEGCSGLTTITASEYDYNNGLEFKADALKGTNLGENNNVIFQSGDFLYHLGDNSSSLRIIDYVGAGGYITVPDYVTTPSGSRLPVTQWGSSVYKTSITGIIMPPTITDIIEDFSGFSETLKYYLLTSNSFLFLQTSDGKTISCNAVHYPFGYSCVHDDETDTDIATVVAYMDDTSATVEVPSTVTGHYSDSNTTYQVVTLGRKLFQGHSEISSISASSVTSILPPSLPETCPKTLSLSLPAMKSIPDAVYDSVNESFGIFGNLCLGDVSLPGVEYVGSRAFERLSVSSLSLPSATTIGDQAFSNLNLEADELILPEVTSVGERAFSSTAIENLSLPKLTVAGDYAFAYTNGCTLDIPKMTELTGRMVDGSTNMTVNAPSVTSISDHAFSATQAENHVFDANGVGTVYDLSTMTLNLPNLSRVGNASFYRAKIGSLPMDNLTEIGDSAFMNSEIPEIKVPRTLTSIGKKAFLGCCVDVLRWYSSVNIPDSCFAYNTCLEYATIGDEQVLNGPDQPVTTVGPASIGDGAFMACPYLKNINIGNSVKHIGRNFLKYGRSITQLVIPASVETIGDGFIQGCDSLRKCYLFNQPAEMEGHTDGEQIYTTATEGSQSVLNDSIFTYNPQTGEVTDTVVRPFERKIAETFSHNYIHSFMPSANYYVHTQGLLPKLCTYNSSTIENGLFDLVEFTGIHSLTKYYGHPNALNPDACDIDSCIIYGNVRKYYTNVGAEVQLQSLPSKYIYDAQDEPLGNISHHSHPYSPRNFKPAEHVNNCTFYVNDNDTYQRYINATNSNGEKIWERLDSLSAYNLAGTDGWAKYTGYELNDELISKYFHPISAGRTVYSDGATYFTDYTKGVYGYPPFSYDYTQNRYVYGVNYGDFIIPNIYPRNRVERGINAFDGDIVEYAKWEVGENYNPFSWWADTVRIEYHSENYITQSSTNYTVRADGSTETPTVTSNGKELSYYVQFADGLWRNSTTYNEFIFMREMPSFYWETPCLGNGEATSFGDNYMYTIFFREKNFPKATGTPGESGFEWGGYKNKYAIYPAKDTIPPGLTPTILTPKWDGPIAVLRRCKQTINGTTTTYTLRFEVVPKSEWWNNEKYLYKPCLIKTTAPWPYQYEGSYDAPYWTSDSRIVVPVLDESDTPITGMTLSMIGCKIDHLLDKDEFYCKTVVKTVMGKPYETFGFKLCTEYGGEMVGANRCYFRLEQDGIPIHADEIVYNGLNLAKPQTVVFSMDNSTGTDIFGVDVSADELSGQNKGVYNLKGQRVGSDLKGLPAGVYIVNGKKAVVK